MRISHYECVGRTGNGVIVQGAKVLATLAPFSDEIFVYPQIPLAPGSHPSYALSFSIPMATRGSITVCRDHYGVAGDRRDHPFTPHDSTNKTPSLSSTDVEVPFERLFIDCDLEVYNKIRGVQLEPLTHTIQTTIRAANKLEFAHQLGTQMTKIMNAENRPDYATMLGEIWAYAQLARSATRRTAEAGARDWGNGAAFCATTALCEPCATSCPPGWPE